MTLKPCAVCGVPSPGPRCEEHTLSFYQSGYDAAWQRLSKRARRLQPFCLDCGTDQDLTTDHSREAWRRKAQGKSIRLQDVAVRCRACNTRKGSAR